MSKYVSEDDAPIVDTPIEGGEGEVITAVSGTEPDMPAQDHDEAIADVTSTRDGDIAPEAAPAPEQRFRFRQEEGEVTEVPAEAPAAAPAAPAEAPVAPVEAPEAPAAPMDAPAEAPAADGIPADAPAAPIADVPAAAPMVAPQPEADVAPMVPQEGEVPAAAPVAPEVEAPTAPVEAPVENAPAACGKKGFRQEDGEEISVVATEEPTAPPKTETEECPESGDEYVTKDVDEQIAPVIATQEDEMTNLEANPTEPVEAEKTNEETIIDPEFAEEQEAAEQEVEQMFRMGYRMEDEAEVSTDSEGGQDVDINVQVRKDDGDAHEADETEVEPAPEQRFRQEDEGEKIETVADITSAPVDAPVPDEVVDDTVPTPDPNIGNPDPENNPEACFQQMFMDGGQWL